MDLSKPNLPRFQKIEHHTHDRSWVISLIPMERRYKLPWFLHIGHVDTLSGGLKQVINTQLFNDRNDPVTGGECRQKKTRALGLINQYLNGETP